MKKSVFVATKPLQYLNCTNIDDDGIKVCMLCNVFNNADDFFSTIKKTSRYFDDFLFFNSKLRALFYVIFHQRGFDKLYLDSDYGLSVRFLLLFLFSTKVYTYEEGYATYSYLRNPVSTRDKIILKITNLLGVQNWSGGSCKVVGTYLYDPEYFKQKIKLPNYNFLKEFNRTFYECVFNSHELLYLSKDIDFNQFQDKNIFIYLSSWNISDRIMELTEKYTVYYKILKLHPHITSYDKQLDEKFDYIIPSNLVFEYFLFRLIGLSKSIHIVHHGTFALHHLKTYMVNNGKLTQEIIKL